MASSSRRPEEMEGFCACAPAVARRNGWSGTGQGEIFHGPQLLPDGRTVLFTVAKNTGDDRWDKAEIVAQSLVDGTRRVLIRGGSDGRYVQAGYLLYTVGGTVYAVQFDPCAR